MQASNELAANERADCNRHLEGGGSVNVREWRVRVGAGDETWKEVDTSTRHTLFLEGEKEAINTS